MNLQRLVEFIHLTHQFRNIERAIDVHGGGRAENDMEHSFQLALVSWYLAQHDHPELNTDRIVKLALVHDLLEAYAGDTNAYADAATLQGKADREAKAVAKLAQAWPEFPGLHQLIAEYEACESPEAQFVYSLDKLMPMLNNYTDGGRGWKQKSVDLKWLKSIKTGKADRSPAAAKYYHELLTELEASPHLFPPTKKGPTGPSSSN